METNAQYEVRWKYTNPDGVIEHVPVEPWMWAVMYRDGTELHQFDDNGIFHRIGEVDQPLVKLWVLYQGKGMGDGRIDVQIPDDMEVTLIHKYRNLVLNAATPFEKRLRVYVFGYKPKGGLKVANYVLPGGQIIQTIGDREPKLSEIVS